MPRFQQTLNSRRCHHLWGSCTDFTSLICWSSAELETPVWDFRSLFCRAFDYLWSHVTHIQLLPVLSYYFVNEMQMEALLMPMHQVIVTTTGAMIHKISFLDGHVFWTQMNQLNRILYTQEFSCYSCPRYGRYLKPNQAQPRQLFLKTLSQMVITYGCWWYSSSSA